MPGTGILSVNRLISIVDFRFARHPRPQRQPESRKTLARRSVWRGKEQTPKSRKSIRTKHLLGGLARVLQSHRELCVRKQPEDFLFMNGAGRSYDPDDLRK
jgi:hypothetical protein